jgi:type 1 glutamine amidotransferase
MRPRTKKVLIGVFLLLGALLASVGLIVGPPVYRATVGFHRYESVPPALPDTLSKPALLIFSKTNGFRHNSIEASNAALSGIAQRRGWSIFVTENAAVFNPDQLRRFNAMVWNSASGDVLTPDQRAAFKLYLEAGGGFLGIHGAGGDLKYDWRWYVETLIGAQFIGHPLDPQLQQATVRVEDNTHPATRGLGATWIRTDEWYSFASSPRGRGYRVLASLDESSYQPLFKIPLPFTRPRDLHMGDHPIIWLHCVGNGRAFYSALGHEASAYAEPTHLQMLEGALDWSMGLAGSRCVNGVEQSP